MFPSFWVSSFAGTSSFLFSKAGSTLSTIFSPSNDFSVILAFEAALLTSSTLMG
ncbi:hypothetical protein OIU77_001320 [Salix suchowensis]|uniref:NADH dehydrogenase subunit 2 n=1 Tax=Salix suchowensis TaxID=1278906 RepID=A0ABQ9B411_9ROSI|nr:hypothetical protein OIU77_001320 [Salix suchowensis]KAJ6370787.1 hypothetical protein OIU77_001320 [Salix suchowensis]